MTLVDVIDALCTGPALEAAFEALGGAISKQERKLKRERSDGTRDEAELQLRDRACEHTAGACDCDPSCTVS